jgi:hypothetical protein
MELHEEDHDRLEYSLRKDFLLCCDCTDGCISSECQCRKRTSEMRKLHKKNKNIEITANGYKHEKVKIFRGFLCLKSQF